MNATGINKHSKDRLFKMIFGRPENKEWTLSLYNAVNGSNYENAEDIQITTIENAVYMGMANDVSFLIEDVMNMYEHQSTFNPNIPMRMLIYAGMLYSKYVEDPRNGIRLHSAKKQKFPSPKLVCFYNGEKEKEDIVELKLKDLLTKPEDTDIEVNVTMLNINYGHNEELLKSCKLLGEYSIFVSECRTAYNETKDLEKAVDRAIEKLGKESPLRMFIESNKAEVRMSIITEYDEERVMNEFKEEGREEGILIGKERGILIGEERGENKLSLLIERLLNQGRSGDIKKAIADLEYRKDLYAEFSIQ